MNALTQLQRPAGDVLAERAAAVYAEALLNVAETEQVAREVLTDLQTLVDEVLTNHPAIAEFFQTAIVGRGRKAEMLRTVFGPDKIHPLLSQFLQVLNEHDRLGLLEPILVVAQRKGLRRLNRFLVEITSAVPLNEAEQQRLHQLLHDITGAEPVLRYREDPQLLGGLEIRTASWLFDGSVRGRLNHLRETLFERQP